VGNIVERVVARKLDFEPPANGERLRPEPNERTREIQGPFGDVEHGLVGRIATSLLDDGHLSRGRVEAERVRVEDAHLVRL
jgi:hypothetical protein